MMSGRHRQILQGVAGGAASAVLTLWLRLYMPATDSFADLRDAPAILLAFFAGPVPALIAGALAAITRVAVGLFGGIGSATWLGSSLATFCATLAAVAARRWVFLGERPSFALGATIAAIVEMLHMAVVLTVGFADFSQAFAVIVAAIPFQCGGVAALVAIASLALNRRQDGRENLIASVLVVSLVTFMILVYSAMAHEASDIAKGIVPMTSDMHMYSCNLATVLYGIVLSALALAFAAYAKRIAARLKAVRRAEEGAGSFRVGLRGRFAISLVAVFGLVGGLVATFVANDVRIQYERGYAESALLYVRNMARYIDGERVRGYVATGRKDEYYESILKLLFRLREGTGIKYFFVIVPKGSAFAYVWDTGDQKGEEAGELGKLEDDFDEDEMQMYRDVFQQKLESGCFVHRNRTYGYLMSATAPILGADGRSVALACIDIPMDDVDSQVDRVVLSIALVTLAIVLLCLAGFYFFVSRYIVSPAERQIQAEEDRIHAELNVARKIQSDALPSVFPAFPGRTDFDVYALMDPAKEVGGDFYDFFLVDETHLAIVIGDVSDKGVPAALFMMTTKTLLKARASRGGTPAEILRDVNDQLCEGNRSGMFVTVYLAILDLETGECRSANAGHEHPALRRKGGRFELDRYEHDPMLGLMPDLSYSGRTFRLSPGDTLLVYTDGVPEAKDASGRMYGMDRMADALNRASDGSVAGLLNALRADVRTFVGNAPQFDDITLLAVTFCGASATHSTNLLHFPQPDSANSYEMRFVI